MRTDIRIKFFIVLLVLVFLSTGNTSAVAESQDNTRIEPPQGLRDKLTFDDLMNGNFPELVHNDYFMPIGSTSPPVHQLSGEIHFRETAMDTNHSDSNWLGSGMRFFPGGFTKITIKGCSMTVKNNRHQISRDDFIYIDGVLRIILRKS